jgi:hypothetical protein
MFYGILFKYFFSEENEDEGEENYLGSADFVFGVSFPLLSGRDWVSGE